MRVFASVAGPNEYSKIKVVREKLKFDFFSEALRPGDGKLLGKLNVTQLRFSLTLATGKFLALILPFGRPERSTFCVRAFSYKIIKH